MESSSHSPSSFPEHSISLPLVSKDEENQFLPLAINVVAKYWGEDIMLESPKDSQKRKGTVIIDGIELAERNGLTCYVFKGSIKDIKKRIDQGIPPIVILPGMQEITQHATIVSGYDVDERRILTYVPEPDTIGAIPEHRFEQDWQQDDMIEIVIIPQDMRDLVKKEDLRFAKSNRLCFEAERLRQIGNTEKAIATLLDATNIDSENAQAWSQLASMYNEQGSEHAVNLYMHAITINPQYYLAYRGLGNYYLKIKDHSLAEAYYSKAISINPNRYGPIYKNRAIARIQNGNNVGAKEDLTKYLEQTPYAQDTDAIRQAISEL